MLRSNESSRPAHEFPEPAPRAFEEMTNAIDHPAVVFDAHGMIQCLNRTWGALTQMPVSTVQQLIDLRDRHVLLTAINQQEASVIKVRLTNGVWHQLALKPITETGDVWLATARDGGQTA